MELEVNQLTESAWIPIVDIVDDDIFLHISFSCCFSLSVLISGWLFFNRLFNLRTEEGYEIELLVWRL
jgi:hypothetical protein